MRKNQRGAAILWAIVVIMVLMITVSAALGISYSYYNRSIRNNERRQAYITAKGLIQDIVEKIELDNSAYISLIPKEEKEVTHLNIALNENDGLGTVKGATITRVEIPEDKKEDVRGKITITVTVEYAGQEDTVNADMQLGRIGELKKWQLLKYYKGQGAEVQENVNIKNAKIMLSHINPIFEAGKIGGSTLKNFLFNLEGRDKMLEKFPVSATSTDPWGGYNGSYYSNDKFREYIYYGIYNEKLPEFDKSAAKNLPKSLENMDLYMQTYCTLKGGASLVYASIFSNITDNDGGEKWKARLVFNEEDGHWYDTTTNDRGAGFGLTGLNDSINRDNEIVKWEEFKKTYFVPERRVD